MRWLLLALLAAGLCACSQTGHLNDQLLFSNTGYDVRQAADGKIGPIYEATAAYKSEVVAQRQKIATNLLYRGLMRVRSDGYEYVKVDGPRTGALTNQTTSRYTGAVLSTKQYPVVQYTLTGYKKGEAQPPQTVSTDEMLAALKSRVSDL